MATISTPVHLAAEEVDGDRMTITCSISQCKRESLVDLLRCCPGAKLSDAGGWVIDDLPLVPARGSYATMEDWRNDQHQIKVDARTTRSKVGAARTMQWLVNTLKGHGYQIHYKNDLAKAFRLGPGQELTSGRHVSKGIDLQKENAQQRAASSTGRNEVFLRKMEEEQRAAKKRRTHAS